MPKPYDPLQVLPNVEPPPPILIPISESGGSNSVSTVLLIDADSGTTLSLNTNYLVYCFNQTTFFNMPPAGGSNDGSFIFFDFASQNNFAIKLITQGTDAFVPEGSISVTNEYLVQPGQLLSFRSFENNPPIPVAFWLIGDESSRSRRYTDVDFVYFDDLIANTSSDSGLILTANANGALVIPGGATPSVSERVLVLWNSSGGEIGLFTITQLGDVGTPWIMKRIDSLKLALSSDEYLILRDPMAGVILRLNVAGDITPGSFITESVLRPASSFNINLSGDVYPGFYYRIDDSAPRTLQVLPSSPPSYNELHGMRFAFRTMGNASNITVNMPSGTVIETGVNNSNASLVINDATPTYREWQFDAWNGIWRLKSRWTGSGI
jgi:hypothetical protein